MISVTVNPDKLDVEFKQYLLLIKSHLLKNGGCSDVSNIAAWIQKLTKNRTIEKLLRNQYLLMLYSQLSKDRLEEPFNNKPPDGDLPEISLKGVVEIDRDMHYRNDYETDNLVIYSAIEMMTVHYIHDDSNRFSSPTRIDDRKEVINIIETPACRQEDTIVAHAKQSKETSRSSTPKKNNKTYACSSVGSGVVDEPEHHSRDERVEGDSTMKDVSEKVGISKFYMRDFGDVLAKEIEDVRTKHKFELVNMRTWHEEEVLGLRSDYTDKLEKMKDYFTQKIQAIEQENSEALKDAEQMVEEKDQEIVRLEGVIQKKCSNLQVQVSTMRGRLCANTKLLRLVAKLERVVSKLERLIAKQSRSKARLIREYEGKLAAAQRKTDLVECTLKLYMMKHREEHGSASTPCSQSEISKAVDKLEQKYKEVVASVQVAAIKRRLKDQKSIEHLLQLTRTAPTLDDLDPAISSRESRQCTSESGDGIDPFRLESEGKNRFKKMMNIRNNSR